MTASHAHSHGEPGVTIGSAGSRYKRSLATVLVLTGAFMLVEAASGFLLNSLALLADAAHMLSDVAAIAMAFAAIWFAQRPATPRRTFGFYRTEILAAVINASTLFVLAGWILYEAWQRFSEPPEVPGLPILAVAVVGLAVSFAGVVILRKGAGESLNMQGAYLETLSDMLGFIGTIIAGGVIWLTGWQQADAVASVFIGLLILPRTVKLLKSGVDVLLEAAPKDVDVRDVETAIRSVPGVESVHDLHVWTITSGFVAMSGHVQAGERRSSEVLHDVREVLHDRFEIAHATIQVERHGEGDIAVCVVDPRCLVFGGSPLTDAQQDESR